MAVTNIFFTGLSKKQIWKERENPCRSNMFSTTSYQRCPQGHFTHLLSLCNRGNSSWQWPFWICGISEMCSRAQHFSPVNFFFPYSQMVPFTVLLPGVPGTSSLSLTLTCALIHTHTQGVCKNYKWASANSESNLRFSNLRFTSKYCRSLFPSKLSTPFDLYVSLVG